MAKNHLIIVFIFLFITGWITTCFAAGGGPGQISLVPDDGYPFQIVVCGYTHRTASAPIPPNTDWGTIKTDLKFDPNWNTNLTAPINFDKYIEGVVFAEMGDGSYNPTGIKKKKGSGLHIPFIDFLGQALFLQQPLLHLHPSVPHRR